MSTNQGFVPRKVTGKLTKAAVTIQLLHSGRNGNPGPIFTVDEIVAEVNKVFPGGKGTSKDCVYFYASKEKIGLSRSNKSVDYSAYDALQALLTPTASPTEEEPEAEEATVGEDKEVSSHEQELAALREQVRLEVEAEIAEHARKEKERRAAVRLVKKNDRKS
jgi:hypothetical protein